ncbi:MAG: sensor domain-containing protein [Chloroflexi bacterium]|nr:sensor domain-containing protein [Chloroflexota bacterium]
MASNPSFLARFFGVALRGQTYLNALYLLLSFPLGIIYFVFLLTGLSVGFPLVIIWIGLVILLAVYLVWYALIAFERQMAIWLLQEKIPPMTREDLSGKSLWGKFTATLANPVTWKGLVYLIAKFPLGILSFSVLVSLVAISASLIGAPFYYHWVQPQIDLGGSTLWVVSTLPEALLLFVVGIFVALVSMHILNGLAWVSGKFARYMLGYFSSTPAAPVPSAVVTPPEVPVPPAAPESPSVADAPGAVE